ncbi:hypothetical protein, partial [Paraglaciecola sp.]|uniref:hypothetical protein n=1 Tax=Paraglaciecola sp. TaxID=1920173 RepID=UPI00273F5CC6
AFPVFDVLSFNWLWQNGDDTNFELPFNNKKVKPDEHMKSLLSRVAVARVVEFRCHASKMDNAEPKIVHLGPDAAPIAYGKHDQAFGVIPPLTSSAFVLHRVCRSATEYVALLTRQRPGVEFPFKNNRFGFSKESTHTLAIDSKKLTDYWAALALFIQECGLADMIQQSRQLVLEKADRLLDVRADIVAVHLIAYLNILKGTPHQNRVLRALEAFGEVIIKDQFAKNYFDAAMLFERQGEIEHAFGYLQLAMKSRPNGPVIQEHFQRLEKLVKKKD